ncbi:hypothetical protein DM80_2309 [Burkholderia multivorans]|nr:hypothetical protein DM80_2309 [Burkholderia multivorans]
MKVHNEIAPPIAVRPASGGLERLVHACIKTTHFCGQVGRGHNCARRVAIGILRAGSGLENASSARHRGRHRPAAGSGAPEARPPRQRL